MIKSERWLFYEKKKIKTILSARVLCYVGTIYFAGDNTDTTSSVKGLWSPDSI